MDNNIKWELKAEHELLGATFNSDLDLRRVEVYSTVENEVAKVQDSCVLSDLSWASLFLVSGQNAQNFINTACSKGSLNIGECGFTCVFSGDGHLISTPYLMRTGTQEYVFIDFNSTSSALFVWLDWLVSLEQDGVAPFENTTVEDVSGMLVPLLLAGNKSRAVLEDYLEDKTQLKTKGSTQTLKLDNTPCLCVNLDVDNEAYLLMIPQNLSRIFFRSFLSFKEVEPIGSKAFLQLLAKNVSWWSEIDFEDDDKLPLAHLIKYNVVRDTPCFVGARGLNF